MANKVFLTFDPDDADLVSTFLVLAEKADPELEFTDWSMKGSFGSPYGPYLRERIRERIASCSVLVCLLGEQACNDAWVDWEVRVTAELGKGLVGVRLHNNMLRDITPQALAERGVTPINWVTSEIIDAIRKAMPGAEAAA